jgi:hypothetical protein
MRRLAVPSPADARALGLALAFGAAGGALFALARMPLAWMMGAMCAVTLAALAGVSVRVPTGLRAFMIAVLGVMLGSAFRPEMFDQAGQWVGSLVGLFIYLTVTAALVTLYFRRIAGYDHTTAFFSAVPGGLSEMIMVGGAMGGDDRTIALTHASRILLVVLVIPFWFRLVEGYVPPAGGIGPGFPSLGGIPPGDLAILVLCGVAGFFSARAARLPAAALTGPMIVSAIAHLAGLTDSRPPGEMIVVAQIVIGTAIGCRFAGTALRRVLRAIAAAAGSTAIMLGLGVALASVVNLVTGLEVKALVLAYAPGGLAEMSLVALALGIDPALVSSHHVVRIFIVVVLAPLAWRMIARRMGWQRPGDSKGD